MNGKAKLWYRDGTDKFVDLSEKRAPGLLKNLKRITFIAPNGEVVTVEIPDGETGIIFQRTILALDNTIGWMLCPAICYAVGYDDHLTWIEPND